MKTYMRTSEASAIVARAAVFLASFALIVWGVDSIWGHGAAAVVGGALMLYAMSDR